MSVLYLIPSGDVVPEPTEIRTPSVVIGCLPELSFDDRERELLVHIYLPMSELMPGGVVY
jgi:hypothetical protein